MGINQIGYPGAQQLNGRINFQQNANGAQVIGNARTIPVVLQPGQQFVLPAGQWIVNTGRYTDIQTYDSVAYRWRAVPTQPGTAHVISSDGVNFRISNSTGTPIGAVISNVGNGNATNGYNTVTVTASSGSSTWATLVGGSLNTTVTVTAGGNFSLPPILVWQPAGNQTFPFVPPEFCCNIASNTINTVTVNYPGSGLTGTGTLTAVAQQNDPITAPGNATLTFNATLTNSGNLTAIWPLTQGTEVTSLPTLSFNIGGTMCANVIMDWTCQNYTVTSCGFNYGNAKPVVVLTGNGIAGHTQATALTGTSYTTKVAMPRMAWLSTTSDANSNISNNGNVVVVDAGKNLQAIPFLVVIPGNANGTGPNGNNPAVLTASVGGITDTTYLTAI